MRKLIVILLMPVLAQAEVNLSVRITGAQTSDFFVGITSFSGEVDDLIVLVTGETAVATSKGALVQKKPINYRPPPHSFRG